MKDINGFSALSEDYMATVAFVEEMIAECRAEQKKAILMRDCVTAAECANRLRLLYEERNDLLDIAAHLKHYFRHSVHYVSKGGFDVRS